MSKFIVLLLIQSFSSAFGPHWVQPLVHPRRICYHLVVVISGVRWRVRGMGEGGYGCIAIASLNLL
jgi:hypothetical protein